MEPGAVRSWCRGRWERDLAQSSHAGLRATGQVGCTGVVTGLMQEAKEKAEPPVQGWGS